jgi:hypothetical protein
VEEVRSAQGDWKGWQVVKPGMGREQGARVWFEVTWRRQMCCDFLLVQGRGATQQ